MHMVGSLGGCYSLRSSIETDCLKLREQNSVCWPSVDPQDVKVTHIHRYIQTMACSLDYVMSQMLSHSVANNYSGLFCRRKRQNTAPSSPVTRSGRVRRSTAGLLGEPAPGKPGPSHEVARIACAWRIPTCIAYMQVTRIFELPTMQLTQ